MDRKEFWVQHSKPDLLDPECCVQQTADDMETAETLDKLMPGYWLWLRPETSQNLYFESVGKVHKEKCKAHYPALTINEQGLITFPRKDRGNQEN